MQDGRVSLKAHLRHREFVHVDLQLAVRQSQDDAGGFAGLGPDLD